MASNHTLQRPLTDLGMSDQKRLKHQAHIIKVITEGYRNSLIFCQINCYQTVEGWSLSGGDLSSTIPPLI